jgi:antitoxin component HigA of HigAB toxin-antitoxin module
MQSTPKGNFEDKSMITAINSESDHKTALNEIERLIDLPARAGTPEGDRLNLLALLVQDYEQKQSESRIPDPIEAIKFRMEQMNLTPRDLVPLIGSRRDPLRFPWLERFTRVSVFRRKRFCKNSYYLVSKRTQLTGNGSLSQRWLLGAG